MSLKQRLRHLETAEPAEIAPPRAVIIRVRPAHARQSLREACQAQGLELPADRPYFLFPERIADPQAWAAWVQQGQETSA
jgi:hypothetical protein